MMATVTFTAGEIAAAINGAQVQGDPSVTVDTLTTDSRQLGDNSLFIPIVGENFDGHNFIESLVSEKKINSFLTMKPEYAEIGKNRNVTSILCPDTLFALGNIASNHRETVNPTVVGITGTNGKTTTKELAAAILGSKFSVLRNEKNYNNEIGVPFTLLNLQPSHTVAVIEMGMNHSGELDRLTKIARPNISLITNVGQGHLEFLGSVENVALAKSEIMHGMSEGDIVIINKETECFDVLNEKAQKLKLNVITFGLSKECDVYPDSYKLMENGLEVSFGSSTLHVPLYGIHNCYNVIAAYTIAQQFDISIDEVQESLSSFNNVGGRSQIINKGYIIIDDTYNSNPLSVQYGLMSIQKVYPDRRKIAVLSDMKELGALSESYHAECGKMVHEFGFDSLLLWGEMADLYKKGALSAGMDASTVEIMSSKQEIVKYLSERLTDRDVVLVKGSRSMKMEEVVNSLTEREE